MIKKSVPRPADALYLRLEVEPDASRQQIVSAYRRLVHGSHPDAHPGDAAAVQRFREITEAYDVLSDPRRRASYDRSRVRPRLDETRPVERGVRPSDEPRDHAPSSEPIRLGIDLPPTRSSAVPLWAGPVRVDPGISSMHTNGSDPLDGPFVEMASLLSRILESWWRY
jgi:curved DNA-binding protein CbpA